MARAPRDRSVLWISALFLIGGLLLLVAGDDQEDRVAGLMAVVLFGGGGLAYWWMHRPRRVGAARRSFGRRRLAVSRTALHHGEVPPARRFVPVGRDVGVVTWESRGRMVAAFFGSSVFVAAGVLSMWGSRVATPRFAGGLLVAGILSILVFGAFGVIAAAGIARQRGLALLPDGVLSRQPAGTAFVPWSELRDVAVLTVADHPSVGLVLGPGARLTGLLRVLRPIQHRGFGCDVTLTLPEIFDTATLAEVLAELNTRPDLHPRLGEPEGVATVWGLVASRFPDVEV